MTYAWKVIWERRGQERYGVVYNKLFAIRGANMGDFDLARPMTKPYGDFPTPLRMGRVYSSRRYDKYDYTKRGRLYVKGRRGWRLSFVGL